MPEGHRARDGRPRPKAPSPWLPNAPRDKKAGFIGKEADAAFALCEQALAIDSALGIKFFTPVAAGVSGDRKGDLEPADELESKALAVDRDNSYARLHKGAVLRFQGRTNEAVAEDECSLALDPST